MTAYTNYIEYTAEGFYQFRAGAQDPIVDLIVEPHRREVFVTCLRKDLTESLILRKLYAFPNSGQPPLPESPPAPFTVWKHIKTLYIGEAFYHFYEPLLDNIPF